MDTLRKRQLLGAKRDRLIMNAKDKYCFEIYTDEEANKLIQWWNDTLFEYGSVSLYDVECRVIIGPEYNHQKLGWSFELTTEKFEMCIKRDSYHLKSYWQITLPKPTAIS